MPEVEDLLVECSDDENDDEELQPLQTSVSLSPAISESTSRYNQDQNIHPPPPPPVEEPWDSPGVSYKN